MEFCRVSPEISRNFTECYNYSQILAFINETHQNCTNPREGQPGQDGCNRSHISAGKADFYIGLILAVMSACFIGTSFIFKKKGLLKLSKRAGEGGHGYLKQWIWWCGMILMGLGEVCNFLAYIFAPATLVAPLGALSVLITAIFSSKFLKERFNLLGKVGCLACIMGATVIVLHTPKEAQVKTMLQLAERLKHPAFITYACLVFVGSLILTFYYGPRFGNTNPLIYITITGGIGSLSVCAIKGVGVAIKQSVDGQEQFTNWLTWFLFAAVILCTAFQIHFLNKSLDIFNTSIVTTMLYVIFTSFVFLASAILFKDWGQSRIEDILGNIAGFLVIVIGVFLLQAFKELDVSIKTLNINLKRSNNIDPPQEDVSVTESPQEVITDRASAYHTNVIDDQTIETQFENMKMKCGPAIDRIINQHIPNGIGDLLSAKAGTI